MAVNVVILSSSPSRRDALRRALESDEVRVVSGNDGDDGWGARPTVTVIDGVAALEAFPDTEDAWPPSLVVLLDRLEPLALDELRRRDAAGWTVLPADATPEQLGAGVLAAAAGLASMPVDWQPDERAVAQDGHRTFGIGAAVDDDAGDDDDEMPREALTPREVEVLGWMARGLSNKQIGARLDISEHTAKFHVASVLAKLGAHNRADAVRRGVRRGLVAV